MFHFKFPLVFILSFSPYLKHDSGQALAMKYQVFQREIKSVIESYENEYKNLYKINGKQSKWAVWEQVKKIAVDSVWEIQNYVLHIKEGKDQCEVVTFLKHLFLYCRDLLDVVNEVYI